MLVSAAPGRGGSGSTIGLVEMAIASGLIVSFFLSDYGLLLGGQMVIGVTAGVWLLGSFVREGKNLHVRRYIVAYASLMVCLFSLNTIFGRDFNFVVFVPIISYIVFSLNKPEAACVNLERLALSILYLLVIPSVAIEVAIKLNLIDFSEFRELLATAGAGRMDVLRVQSPFGSPLSLASLAFALMFYFAFFSTRKVEIPILLILLIMTGSRTALAASVALLLGRAVIRTLSNGVYRPINVARTVTFAVSASVLVVSAVIYLNRIGMGHIVARALSLQSYNLVADQSFLDRADTSLSTLSATLTDLPRSLFLGQQRAFISDSAFVSIAAESGLLTAVAFFCMFCIFAFRLRLGELSKVMFICLISLLVAMVGDAVVPLVTFFFFMIFFTYGEGHRQAADAVTGHNGEVAGLDSRRLNTN